MAKKEYTWNDVVAKFFDYYNMSCKPDFKRMKQGTIIDEDKSVRWNKEQVLKNNEDYDKEVARLNTLKNKARDEANECALLYIQNKVGNNCSKDKALSILNFAYEYSHANGINEIGICLEDLIKLARTLMAE